MNVGELIDRLAGMDREKPIVVSVHTSSRAYSVAECPIEKGLVESHENCVTLCVWLPEGMYAARRVRA